MQLIKITGIHIALLLPVFTGSIYGMIKKLPEISKFVWEKETGNLLVVAPESIKIVEQINEIDKNIAQRIEGKSWPLDCPIPLKDLRYLKIPYVGYDGHDQLGEMIVHKNFAEKVVRIFKKLYIAQFPIEKICLVDDYFKEGLACWEIDEKVMADNVTSSFWFRFIGKTNKISEHGILFDGKIGCAIDINPKYNPFVRKNPITGDFITISPATSNIYIDRTLKGIPGLITADSVCVILFEQEGFNWGGNWKKVQDYQHFGFVQKESIQ